MRSGLRQSSRPYAIVIGLDSMPGLQAARILAHREVPVIAIARDPKHYNCRTKVCEEILFANTESDEFIATLVNLGPKLNEKAVLFPCGDMNVLLAARHRQRLEEWYHVILPATDAIEMMIGKISFYTFAQKEGFPIPRTFFIRSETDIDQVLDKITFPCILKPSMSATPEWGKKSRFKALKISNSKELLTFYDRCKAWTDTLILQEWIKGPESNLYSCNCYFDANSEPVVTFVARKIRQYPPEIGESSLGEECRDDVVLQETVRLFQNVRFRGLGYVEMKRDECSGKYFIIEPNVGRPTGRSAIAEAGGVELLYTMYSDALGWPLPANRKQKYTGVKWIYLRRDFQTAFHYWIHGELRLKDWWQSLCGRKTYAVFSRTDTGPFLGDLQRAIRMYLSPRERRKRKDRNPRL